VQYKKPGNENSIFLNSMVLPATGANCRSLKKEEMRGKTETDYNSDNQFKDTFAVKKCMA